MSTQTSSTKPSTTDFKGAFAQLEQTLEEYFGKKAPALPDNAKELIVKFSPWIALIMIVMFLPLLLGAFGLSALFMPFSFLGGMTQGFSFIISWVFVVAIVVLEAIAIPGLMKREKKAWYKVYYAALLSIVQNIVTFNLGSLIIGGLISFYILFQIKEKYTK